jgi:hypothetical protein
MIVIKEVIDSNLQLSPTEGANKSLYSNVEAFLFCSVYYLSVFWFFLNQKPKQLQTAKASETSISANDEPDFVLPELQKSLADKNDLQLFTQDYIETIGASLESFIESKAFLNTDFKLVTIVKKSNIPAHHLTYYFNDIKQVFFRSGAIVCV